MKIAFIVHRANYLKHYGPIIDAALARDWEVEVLLLSSVSKGKEYLNIHPSMIEGIWGDRVNTRQFKNNEEIKALYRMNLDAVISLHPRSRYPNVDRDLKFITLQHSVDTFEEASHEELASSDHICLFTPFWLDYAARFYEKKCIATRTEVEKTLTRKIAYTGFAQMDAFENIDPIEVRKRWGMDLQKPVVLLLPVELAGWPGAWPHFFAAQAGLSQWRALFRGGMRFAKMYWQWALRGWNDRALTDAIRGFCDNNGAYFLIKAREKDPLRPVLVEKADKAFYDQSYYPATIFEAIAIASLCILFYSTAAQEAAYAGVPALCIDRPNKNQVKHQLWRRQDIGGPYNFGGVVTWTTIPQIISSFRETKLGGFSLNLASREEYLLKYVGPADYKASHRILDLIGTNVTNDKSQIRL